MSLPDGEKVVWYKQPFRHNARVWQTDKQTESDTDINIKIHVGLKLNHRRRKLEKLECILMRQYNKIFRQVSRRQRNVRSEMDGCSWVCTARHICGPPGPVAAAARHRVSRKRNDIACTPDSKPQFPLYSYKITSLFTSTWSARQRAFYSSAAYLSFYERNKQPPYIAVAQCIA